MGVVQIVLIYIRDNKILFISNIFLSLHDAIFISARKKLSFNEVCECIAANKLSLSITPGYIFHQHEMKKT